MSTLVELFSDFQHVVGFMLPEVLAFISSTIDQDSEELSRIGIKCWLRLMHVAGASPPPSPRSQRSTHTRV
jgi:hypothetical protein